MNLFLHVRKEYFDQIKSGEKKEEYRLIKPYWIERLNRNYDGIYIFRGYPKSDDWSSENFTRFPWRGFETRMIKHKEFGDYLVQVFVIKLQREEEQQAGES
jgi:hypothetical protein